MKKTLALLALVALAAAVPAEASMQRLAPRLVDVVMVPDGGSGFEGSTVLRVRALESGQLYAKVLPTATNPVHDGVRSNGTVAGDRSAGLTGWWVRFDAAPADEPSARISWGHYADGSATPSVSAPADSEWDVTVTVHAPALAAAVSIGDEVPIVVGLRPDSALGAEGSGASLDDSVLFRLRVVEPPGLSGLGGEPAVTQPESQTRPQDPQSSTSDTVTLLPAGPAARIVAYAGVASAAVVLLGLLVYAVVGRGRSTAPAAPPTPQEPAPPPPLPEGPGPAAPAWLRKYRQPDSGLGDRLQRLRRA